MTSLAAQHTKRPQCGEIQSICTSKQKN